MNEETEFIRSELGSIRHLVEIACIREGELRGGPVSPHDQLVQIRVAEMILTGYGARFRHELKPPSSPL